MWKGEWKAYVLLLAAMVVLPVLLAAVAVALLPLIRGSTVQDVRPQLDVALARALAAYQRPAWRRRTRLACRTSAAPTSAGIAPTAHSPATRTNAAKSTPTPIPAPSATQPAS